MCSRLYAPLPEFLLVCLLRMPTVCNYVSSMVATAEVNSTLVAPEVCTIAEPMRETGDVCSVSMSFVNGVLFHICIYYYAALLLLNIFGAS
jgi:hypothetical protein